MPIRKLNSPSNCALFICDIQEKFSTIIPNFSEIVSTTRRLIDTARILSIPTVVSEQYPEGLGSTVTQLKGGFSNDTLVFDKLKFSMCCNPSVEDVLKSKKIENVILTGIEAHICILQTTLDLLETKGINVYIVVDAVSSRTSTDCRYALKQMENSGAILTTSESVIFGLLGGSDHPKFKEIQKLIPTFIQ